MDVNLFYDALQHLDVGFFAGVPDSQLQAFCTCLMIRHGIGSSHVIAANEGNAVGLAAGYHLSTGRISCVYLQNSGLGNCVNPITSLLHEQVYGIPCVFVVGWRGEPGIHDEPQHVYQGAVTLPMLELLGIDYLVLDASTQIQDLITQFDRFRNLLQSGKGVAIVVKKGGLTSSEKQPALASRSDMTREAVIRRIVATAQRDVIVATTGKTSRELFEIREQQGQAHHFDFLTVGSMGHSSSIALGLALGQPDRRVWCLDGDGAALMHLGAMAVIGQLKPERMIHVVINNGAHESVGGQPTAASVIDLGQIANGCGYRAFFRCDRMELLDQILHSVTGQHGPIMLEVITAVGSRPDLGRPTTTPAQNKMAFMAYMEGVQ